MRIMTFNILTRRNGSGQTSWESRRDAVVSVIRKYDPDIFCLQEAHLEQLACIAERFPAYKKHCNQCAPCITMYANIHWMPRILSNHGTAGVEPPPYGVNRQRSWTVTTFIERPL